MQSEQIPVFLITDDPRHMPLALGMIVAHAQHYNDGALLNRLRFLPTTALSTTEVLKVGSAFGPGIWLFSNYVWTTPRCQKISKAIKSIDPRNITIHGGPNAPSYEKVCEAYFQANKDVDFVVRGEGEITASELLDHISRGWSTREFWNESLASIKGISFARPDSQTREVIRTADRPRTLDLEKLPSPYLSGVYEKGYISELEDGSSHNITGATIETNRGCPYKCTFCDWGSLTNQKISHFSTERVQAEIEWIAAKRIPILLVADANFGIFKRDIEIAEIIAQTKKKFGYPKEVQVSYAKNDSKKRVEIVKIFLEAGLSSQGVVSIQTRDTNVLKAVKRQNIRNESYDGLSELFRQEKMPLTTELMIGLPGSTVESLKKDLQFYFDRNILARAFYTRVLMNSPMADPEYMARHQIVTADGGDLIVSTSSFSQEDYELMVTIYAYYRLFVRYSVLTYVMRYLQWEYGVSAADFLHRVAIDAQVELPLVSQSIRLAREPKYPRRLADYVFHHSKEVYDELIGYIRRTYGISESDSSFNTVVEVNVAVIPSADNIYPHTVTMKHDFGSYFNEGMSNKGIPINKFDSYEANSIEISDPNDICGTFGVGSTAKFNPHQTFFELESSLKAFRSRPHWLN